MTHFLPHLFEYITTSTKRFKQQYGDLTYRCPEDAQSQIHWRNNLPALYPDSWPVLRSPLPWPPLSPDPYLPSWPSSPPHWLSQKRKRAHMKPSRLSYFTNFVGLHRPGGLMVKTLAWVDIFPWALVSLMFDFWYMYIFLVGSNLAFLRVFGYFLFPIGILFFLMFLCDFTWHEGLWINKNSIN